MRPAALLLTAVLFLPGPADAERLPIRRFDVSNGLGNDWAAVVRQDRQGWIWIGTFDGVSRFDGTNFRNFGVADGLPPDGVADVIETRDGTLLFATDAGVCRFAPADAGATAGDSRGSARFVCDLPAPGEEASEVRVFHQDRFGNLWVGTAGGLFRAQHTRDVWTFTREPLGPEIGEQWSSEGVRDIAEDPSGGLWFGTAVGLAHRDPNGRVWRSVVSTLNDDRVFSILLDDQGLLWIGHVNDGLFVWRPPADLGESPARKTIAQRVKRAARGPDGLIRLPKAPDEVIQIRVADGLSDDRVRAGLLEDRDGTLWIGTVRGLSRFRPSPRVTGAPPSEGRLDRFERQHGLVDDGVRPSLLDRAGNVWFGSPSGGASRLRRGGFVSYDASDGLRGFRVRSIFETADGALTVLSASDRDYVQRFDGERFEAVSPRLPAALPTPFTGWASGQVGVHDREGSWWFTTGILGVLRYAPTRRLADLATAPLQTLFGDRYGMGILAALVVTEDHRGDMWFGAYRAPWVSVWRRETGLIESLPSSSSPTSKPPAAFAGVFREDAGGRMWAGFHDGSVGWFEGGGFHRLGVAPASATAITDLDFDADGDLWITTNGAGLLRVAQPATAPRLVESYTVERGLAGNDLECFVDDLDGHGYVGSGRGVDRIDLATGDVTHFTTADGLANNLVTAGYRDRHGDLWFGTMQGLSRLILRREAVATRPTVQARITSVELAGVPQSIAETGARRDGLSFVTSGDRLRVGFVAPSGDLDLEPAYRYRLEGLDPDWSPPTRDHAVNYARLAPGRYRFVVEPVRSDGGAATGASFDLRVLPPLWRRWWFLLAVSLAIAAAALALHRQRLARALAIERVRARIAADLHDDLGASLSRIAVLSEVASRKAPADQPPTELRQIADTARQLTEEASDMVWAIDPHHDDLGSLLARLRRLAADLLGERGIAFEFSAPPDAAVVHLSPDHRRHLMLILKEALHNAARHAEAHTVSVRVDVTAQRIHAEVIDDGKGFDPDHATQAPAGGRGLRNFAQRARDLGATVEVRSAPGEGTTVTLSMPR